MLMDTKENEIVLKTTKFTNTSDGDTSYGVRIWDDFGSSYLNNWNGIPKTEEEVLELVYHQADPVIEDILEQAMLYGMFVNEKWFSKKDVRRILDKSDNAYKLELASVK